MILSEIFNCFPHYIHGNSKTGLEKERDHLLLYPSKIFTKHPTIRHYKT